MIKAVLFDLDGTLLDTAPDLIATVNYLRGGLGLEPIPVAELRHFVSKGAAGLIRAGLPPCDDETLLSRKDSFLEYYQQYSFVDSRPFEGVELLLSELTNRGVPWGIVTNKPEYLSLPILKKIGWLSSASAVICGDTVSRGKPHPEPVLTACRIMNLQPETVLVVGDDLRDVEAGKRAGCHTAFILYGYADRKSQFAIADDTAMINSPNEVLDLLAHPMAGL
jgi:phosphoglycolate phosphatase